MEAGKIGFFIQEAFTSFLKCLGLEGGGGVTLTSDEVVVNNPPPPSPPLVPAADHDSTIDPLVDTLASPVDNTVITTTETDNNLEGESNFNLVAIDEILNISGGTTTEAHYVELIVGADQPNTNFLTTSLISTGGGGKTH